MVSALRCGKKNDAVAEVTTKEISHHPLCHTNQATRHRYIAIQFSDYLWSRRFFLAPGRVPIATAKYLPYVTEYPKGSKPLTLNTPESRGQQTQDKDENKEKEQGGKP